MHSLAEAGRATRLRATADSDDDAALWIATETLPQARALFPDAAWLPEVTVPAEYAAAAWDADGVLAEWLRSRLTGLGPATVAALAASLRQPAVAVEIALARLESEGYVMRGRFSRESSEGGAEEWCERHLLARIHRYTVGRLRREIEPVSPRDFVRFLFDWQRVSAATRMSGRDAVEAVLAQLQGFEAPAAVWEGELLSARIADYSPAWLDDLCSAGRVSWARLRPARVEAGTAASPSVRQTPIVLLPRRELAMWSTLTAQRADDAPLSSRALRVVDCLRVRGASFFDELERGAHLLKTELEEALSELVARGRVTCDSYAGLRALLVPPSKREGSRGGRSRRAPMFGIQDAGRWSLTPRPAEDAPVPAVDAETVEHAARSLLDRYGVVFWRLIEREASWLPPWRDLLRVYRRWEARGEIRGGRFVSGMSGEQFALPDAIGALRKLRQRPDSGELVCVSAMDPLNLAGTVLAGERVARLPGARVLFRDGLPIASLSAGKVEMIEEALTPDDAERVRQALVRRRGTAADPDTALYPPGLAEALR